MRSWYDSLFCVRSIPLWGVCASCPPFQLSVTPPRWVVYEYAGFKGRQMLLQCGDTPSWGRESGWDTVGSLHVLRQVGPPPRKVS